MVQIDATDSVAIGSEDTPLEIDLSRMLNSPTDTLTLLTEPTNGSVELSSTGLVSLAPDADFYGTEVLQYSVCHANGLCSEATITFTFEPVNDAPVAVSESIRVAEDTRALILALNNDNDVDGDELVISSVEVVDDSDHTLVPTRVAWQDGRIEV